MAYIISSGVTSDSLTIESGNSLIITDGGTANNTTANECGVFVSTGGVANITFINGGTFHIYNGGTGSQTVLNGDEDREAFMLVTSGGSADAVMVNAFTKLQIDSGGTVTNIIWTPCVGQVSAYEDAEALFYSKYTGVYYGTGNSLLSNAATMDCQAVGSDYEMFVMSGGIATRTTVDEGGHLYLWNGSAYYTTLNAGALVISGGEVVSATNKAGEIRVSSGGVAGNISVLNDGVIKIYNGGEAHTVIATGAGIEVYSGGVVNGFTLRGGAGLYADTYAKITGRMIISDEADISIDHGATIDFNISNLTPGAAVRINNFSLFSGWESADYTITISDTQANGTYSLALGFPEFERTISVVDTSGTVLDTLSIGETKVIGDEEFTLKLADDTLSLQKGREPDPQPIRPDGADEGQNNWLYDKKEKDVNHVVTDAAPVMLGPEVTEVCPDGVDGIMYEENETVFHNFVGKDDPCDYVKIGLEKGANLCFSLIATDAAKFTLWKLTSEEKNGKIKYSVKSLQATTLKKTMETGIYYTAQTKPILLESGEYYLSMESTNAAKGGSAYYNVTLEPENNTYFLKGDNSDDWTDVKTAGPDGAVGDAGTLNADTESVIADGWVGFGDAVDYRKITVESAAKLSFAVEAAAPVKFTVWKLNSKTDKKGTTWSLKSLQSVKISKADGTGKFTTETASLFLKNAGEYYLSVESPDAAKGADADYTVALEKTGTVFFTDLDDTNNWLYDKKTKTPNPAADSFVSTGITASTGEIPVDEEGSVAHEVADGTIWRNFVGYGDDTDYAKITLSAGAELVFHVSATDAAKFAIISFSSETKNGKTKYTEKALQTTTLKKAKDAKYYEATTKALSLDAGTYYISMTSTNASKGGAAYYRVELDTEHSINLPVAQAQDESALSAFAQGNEADPFGAADAQDSFGAFAAASASGLAGLPDDDLALQAFANLA